MKRASKVISLIMATLMVISMVGCGQAKDANTFRIGSSGPLTGGAAAYGIAVKNALELAVEEINAAGGVNGYKFEVNCQDDEHNAEKAVNAYNNLKDWGAQVFLGTVTSAPCIAVSELTKADNMFQLTPSGTAVDCTKYDNAFRVCFSDPSQGVESAKYINANKLATKVAVIYDSSDPYSAGIYEAFVKESKNSTAYTIVSQTDFTNESNTTFKVQLEKAKNAGADMIFLPVYYQQAAVILAEAKAMNYAPKFFGVDGMDGILTGVDNFDTKLTENVMFLTPFAATSTDENIVKFVKAYQDKFGETPNQFAADAYDAVYILKAAIEASGVKPTDSVSDICDAVKGTLTNGSFSFSGLTGKNISWTTGGEPNKAPSVVIIKNGVYNEM
jgi:branched-chain amino acid transport system substrate-binding protein